MAEGQQQGTYHARDRLARISHHFLSEAENLGIDHAADLRLAVFDDPDARGRLSIDALARALALEGREVGVIDPPTGLVSLVRAAAAPEPVVATAPTMDATRAPWKIDTLLIAASRAGKQLEGCSSVLLPLPCSRAGMRRAFARLKSLMQDARPPLLGVTVIGAADRASAEACFDRFARATVKFLGLTPQSYAYTGALAHTDRQVAQLKTIAQLLLQDWQTSAAPGQPRSVDPVS